MLIVIESLFNAEEVQSIRAQLDAAHWRDGRVTAGTLAAKVKDNQQLADDDPLVEQLGATILARLGVNPLFTSAALPAKIYPPKFNRYRHGGNYGTHVDAAVMTTPEDAKLMRTDLSATLYFSGPNEYDDGELTIETEYGAQEVKLDAGDLILYPSTSLHRVNPVTRGARVSAFFWVQSMVRDTAQRSMLFDLDQSIQSLTTKLEPGDREVLRLNGIYHNLVRSWAL